MGHELDITDGTVSYADSRAKNGKVDAWHRLGQTIGRVMEPREALDLAHMNGWNVRKQPLVATVTETMADREITTELVVPGKHVVVRDNPVTGKMNALGVVGDQWQPVQNEQTVDLLADITDQSGAFIETIGALDQGKRTFVTMKMPSHMTFTSPTTGVEDVTDLYIAIFNNHDGGGALRAVVTPVRVVCANTQRMAEHAARSMVSLRHSGSPTAKLAEVRDLLGMTFTYQDTYVAECEALIAKQRDDEWVRAVLNRIFKVDKADTEQAKNRRVGRASEIMELYRTSETVAPFYGTAYGAMNAVTEYIDHFQPVQGKGDVVLKQAIRAIGPDGGAVKSRSFAAFASID